MLSAKQIGAVNRARAELKAVSREADYLDGRGEYETAESLRRAASFVLLQLEEVELLALPATDDVPLAA